MCQLHLPFKVKALTLNKPDLTFAYISASWTMTFMVSSGHICVLTTLWREKKAFSTGHWLGRAGWAGHGLTFL